MKEPTMRRMFATLKAVSSFILGSSKHVSKFKEMDEEFRAIDGWKRQGGRLSWNFLKLRHVGLHWRTIGGVRCFSSPCCRSFLRCSSSLIYSYIINYILFNQISENYRSYELRIKICYTLTSSSVMAVKSTSTVLSTLSKVKNYKKIS